MFGLGREFEGEWVDGFKGMKRGLLLLLLYK